MWLKLGAVCLGHYVDAKEEETSFTLVAGVTTMCMGIYYH